MGYIAHHAIVVTGDTDQVDQAHALALPIFDGTCTDISAITTARMNDTASFLVAPDGSKEGWTDSDIGDERRATFISALRAGGIYVDWVLVRFGGDDYDVATIDDHSGNPEYEPEDAA